LAGFTCLLLLSSFVKVAAGQHYFRRYTGADGLSQALVQAIYQDRTGYLWIGTQAGLNRYDGTAFTIYSIQQGLANDWINAIAQDAGGRLWLATLGGVSAWDGHRFWNYTTVDGLADNRIASLVIDREGIVWCATPHGVSRYDGRAWRTYTTADGLPAANVNTLLIDQNGQLWAGTSDGLAYLKGGHFIPFDAKGLLGKDIRTLTQDRQHRLWVGLADGVRAYEGDRLIKIYTQADGLIGLPVTALRVDQYGIVWVATSQGLGAIQDGQITFLTARNGLHHDDVRSLFEDREGVLWIGAFGGLYKFQGRAFTNYGVADGLGSDSVRPILRDRRGILWVGTIGGLSRFDGRTWRNYTVADGLIDNTILALQEDRSGRLWIGTRTGLTLFDGVRFINDPSLTPDGKIVALVQDHSGTMWCAIQPGGLFKQVGRQFEPVDVPEQTFSNGRLLVDHQGMVWASGDNGLSRWDGRRWRTYTTQDGLADNHPYFLCQDQTGRIWFGYHSSRGLSSFDGAHFQHYTSAQGLGNDAVYSLGVDRQDHLWIGTARGVDRFDGRTFTNYGTEEGYADNESNAGGFFADDDGTLWFGTVGGLSHYDPRFDLTGGDPPSVELTELRLGTDRFSPDLSPTVEHGQNELFARIVAFSFINEKQLSFQYRLLGLQATWSPLLVQEIRIPNLPSGRYALEVRARKYQGPWSKTVHFGFTIGAPFWQTFSFWVLVFTLVATLLYAGYRFQIARVRRRAEQLEQKVDERTRELAQKTEELESFIYTVSHDLKAPVISLQGLASLLQLELGDRLKESAALYLERIHANTVHMQRLINELLELSRVGRLAESKEPVNMNDLIQEVTNELHGQIELKQAVINVSGDLPMARCERNRLRQVWLNLIANALHYCRPDSSPVIEIGGQEVARDGTLGYFVRDNGIGIAKEHQEKVFDIFYRVEGKYNGSESTGVGLAIVKRIIESHGGRVWVQSEGRGAGSTFWFTLPTTLKGDDPV
jgi:ligand-binding sensor domain-containing protein/signal transduction histidine kinase